MKSNLKQLKGKFMAKIPNETNTFLQKKENLIKIYTNSFGNVTMTCKAVGINRWTFYDWLKKYPDFAEEIKNINVEEVELDFYENALRKRIEEKSDACLIFALKCKGKRRGYVERQEIDYTNKEVEITVNIPKADNEEDN